MDDSGLWTEIDLVVVKMNRMSNWRFGGRYFGIWQAELLERNRSVPIEQEEMIMLITIFTSTGGGMLNCLQGHMYRHSHL